MLEFLVICINNLDLHVRHMIGKFAEDVQIGVVFSEQDTNDIDVCAK